MNLRSFVDNYIVKFLKSRCKRFARSFRSMNPRNFGDTYNFKFLKRRKVRSAISFPGLSTFVGQGWFRVCDVLQRL